MAVGRGKPGPAKVLGTSLPACFASKMRQWKFPKTQTGAPITNFPFPKFTIK